MPGFPVAACRTADSRSTDQPSHEDAYVHLSAEEKLAAEDSLSFYCMPVEFYNILQRRAIQNPLFLQRCLGYKREAKHNKRVQMTVSLSWTDEETKTVLPLYICLARRVPNIEDAQNNKYSSVHGINRIFIFQDSSGIDGNTQIQADFRLPAVNKLAEEAKSGSLSILFFTNAAVGNPNSSSGVNSSLVPFDPTSCESSDENYCLCGKVSLESLYDTWNSLSNFSLGQQVESMSTVKLLPCLLKRDFKNKWRRTISILDHCSFENESISKNVRISISAEDFGAKEKSPYLTYASSHLRSSSLSRIIRLREGNVMFNYRYYHNKLQRTEVTEDFFCPFCLVSCGSYKGLRDHLPASHDLFNFEFLAPEDCQAVNVSLKTNIWRYGIFAEAIDPKLPTFFYCCGKIVDIRSPENASFENANDVNPLVLESEIPAGDTEPLEEADENADGPSNGIIVSNTDPDCVPSIPEYEIPSIPEHEAPSIPEYEAPPIPEHEAPSIPEYEAPPIPEHEAPSIPEYQAPPIPEHEAPSIPEHEAPSIPEYEAPSIPEYEAPPIPEHEAPSLPEYEAPPIPEHDHGTPAVHQVAKKGKLPVQHSDSQSLGLLTKRTFYHSRTAQPMALEEVLADEDSEDEVDDDVRNTEGQKMFDNFEMSVWDKRLSHMWNTFVRKQKVLADSHMPWACEAFSKLHAAELQSTGLAWSWRMLRLKLLNINLLDARTFDKCSVIIQEYKEQI